jgi:hypothetical protein
MSDPIAFHDMRQALSAAQIEAQLLLALPGLEWPRTDYAFFMAMADMTQKARKQNPTRKQMLAMLGAWLRFYKRLVEALPADNELRGKMQAEFNQVSEPYQGLLNDTKSV